MNTVCLIGRLTKSPELKQTPAGVSVARMTLAVDRRFKKGEVDYIDVTAWRNTADFISQYFSKGLRVGVVGSIQVRSYTDKDGNNRKATEVVAEQVFFADGKKEVTVNENEYEQVEFSADDDLPF